MGKIFKHSPLPNDSLQTSSDNLKTLIERNLDEGAYQTFLEQHTQFIPRSFLLHHDVHFDIVFKQYPIFEDYRADFMFLTKTSGEWRCVLIELEKPSSKYFKTNNEPHGDFRKGLDQIHKWRAHLSEHTFREAFKLKLKDMLVGRENHPFDIRYVLVTGRRAEYRDNEMRKRIRQAQKITDNLEIMSYDSLPELRNSQLILASKKNESIHLHSFNGVSETIFECMGAEKLTMSSEVKAQILGAIDDGRLPLFGKAISTIYERQKQSLRSKIEAIRVLD